MGTDPTHILCTLPCNNHQNDTQLTLEHVWKNPFTHLTVAS
jgi:hypothetical protein